jgi:hypothetical protein
MHMKSNLKIVISCRCFSDFLVHIHAFQATNPTLGDSDHKLNQEENGTDTHKSSDCANLYFLTQVLTFISGPG